MAPVEKKLPGLVVTKGRDLPARFRHPWIFSGAIKKIPDKKEQGLIEVFSAGGEYLGRGFFNPENRLSVRMLSFTADQPFLPSQIAGRIKAAYARRRYLFNADNTAARIVFAESDFLPGFVADLFGDVLSVQFNSAFSEFYREEITAALEAEIKPRQIVETSDLEARKRDDVLKEIPDTGAQETQITRNGLNFHAAVGQGQKTGFYLDQCRNHALVAAYAKGRRVLDMFCYSGGFTVNCAALGATTVDAVDSSAGALELAQKNLRLNNDKIQGNIRTFKGDAFELLRKFRENGDAFGLIILDPPKLAPSRGKIAQAERAYKDLNMQALALLQPGGRLATFSCSGAMVFDAFRKILHYAAHDAGRDLQIVSYLSQAEDHPVLLSFPESEYLRGFLCRVF